MFDNRIISADKDHILYLLDGTSFCYRSFYAVKNLSTSKGFPTNAIYGFIGILKKLIDKFQPVFLGVCFDVSRKTFRRDKFPAYKIQRPALEDDFKVQIPYIKEITRAYGFKVYEKEGFEADDLIATLTEKVKPKGINVVIVSSDKDILQLVDDSRVISYDPVRDVYLDENAVQGKIGVLPKYILDFLAVCGDSADNIPGAKGIGPKTASPLIRQFGNVDGIFRNIDRVKPERVKQILLNSREDIYLSRSLVELDKTVDIDFSLEDVRVSSPDIEKLKEMFVKFEFRKFLNDLPGIQNANQRVPEGILPAKEDILRTIDKEEEFTFLVQGQDVYFLSKGRIYKTSLKQTKPVLENGVINKVSWNIKEIMISAAKLGIEFNQPFFDVMVAAYVVNSNLVNSSFEDVVWFFLKEQTLSYADRLRLLRKLYRLLLEDIKNKGLERIFSDIETPLIKVLADMQKTPISIDVEYLKRMSEEIRQKRQEIIQQAYSYAGGEFNLNSPKQLADILYNQLKLPVYKKTKTGFSTNEDTLQKLEGRHPLIKSLLDYRKLNKLINTYLEPLILQAGGENKLYPIFLQTATQTGRLSSHSPNLQNIPIREELGRKIRGAFVPGFNPGRILSADYSQIELRILAHLCRDKQLIEDFIRGKDVHTATAAVLFNKDVNSITYQERNFAKRINFGIVYGMSPYGLARELKISVEEAGRFIDGYFQMYTEVRNFIDSTVEKAARQGYVTTIFGRRRYIDLPQDNSRTYELAKRQAINAPVQGSAADIIKMAMVDISRRLMNGGFRSRMIIQVHDELVFDVYQPELKDLAVLVKDSMENIVSLNIPLKVNLKIGKDWFNMETMSM